MKFYLFIFIPLFTDNYFIWNWLNKLSSNKMFKQKMKIKIKWHNLYMIEFKQLKEDVTNKVIIPYWNISNPGSIYNSAQLSLH